MHRDGWGDAGAPFVLFPYLGPRGFERHPDHRDILPDLFSQLHDVETVGIGEGGTLFHQGNRFRYRRGLQFIRRLIFVPQTSRSKTSGQSPAGWRLNPTPAPSYTPPTMTYRYDISGDDFSSAGAASSAIKKKLRQLGLTPAVIKRTAIAMYEAEINMVIHAGGGRTEVSIEDDRITIVMIDQGPGIPDINMAMTEGYSTASDAARSLGFGAGMGLPNIEKNVDDLRIESTVGKGTVVTLTLRLLERPE